MTTAELAAVVRARAGDAPVRLGLVLGSGLGHLAGMVEGVAIPYADLPGLPQAGVVAHFSRPFPAIVTGLFAVIGMAHWIRGTRILIDDYVEDPARPWVLIASQVFGWAVIAIAVFALARMALATISA